MPGYAPINMKTKSSPTNSLTANTIYRLRRSDDSFVAPDYANDYVADTGTIMHGMLFQNRTVGNMYVYYGQVPAELQVPSVFAAAAYIIPAGGSFTPPMSQTGLCYVMFASPAAGYLVHMAH